MGRFKGLVWGANKHLVYGAHHVNRRARVSSCLVGYLIFLWKRRVQIY